MESRHRPTFAARRQVLRLAAAGLGGLGLPALAQGPTPLLVRHSMAQQQSASEITYELAVLQLLLDKTVSSHGPYRLEGSVPMSQNRAFLQLAAGEVDLISSMTSRERETQGLPVRVCLYRGLLGVRLPLVLQSRLAEIDALGAARAPRELHNGQVADWPDTAVLTHNGWLVERLPRLGQFAELLRRRRLDLVSLGALEAYPIAETRPHVAVGERWAIAYPSAFYFFVGHARPELAERLRAGWDKALSDGSFEALFEQRLGAQLRRARLEQRQWWLLENPDLPAATPLGEVRLWHPLVRTRLLGESRGR
ncbi:UNVERIFIED_ORG: hypothetical protein LHJ69_01795 [Shinella sp. XGS7]|nr:hypothetical protein [Shinella sp. XGS7]